jgi:electron transfer flavoprotein beta subunit
LRIAVCVKHAVDEGELKVDPEGRPVLQGAATKLSTFDKNAVEEALRLKDAQGEVVIFTVGPADAKKSLKEALAMGADSGRHVVCEPGTLDSLGTSAVLAEAIKRSGSFDFVICSEGSSDAYTGQVPPMVAERLGFSYIGYARKIEAGTERVRVERALEDSVEVVEGKTPMVVSVVSEINEPRYPTLIQIMQASKKPVQDIALAEVSSVLPPRGSVVVDVRAQAMSRKKVLLEGPPGEAAAKLLDALAAEGVL